VRDFVTIRVANFMNNLLAVLLLALPLIAFLSAGIIELRSERSATQKVLSCLPAFLGVLVHVVSWRTEVLSRLPEPTSLTGKVRTH